MAGGLRRGLGWFGAMNMTVGSMIGVGIFFTPQQVAAEYPSLDVVLLLWLVGGLVTLAGALSAAELATLFPKAGGPYVYVREAFGERAGFLASWASFIVGRGSAAVVALLFATFLAQLLPLTERGVLYMATWGIAFVVFVNWLGLRPGAFTQNLLTAVKVGVLVVVAVLAFVLPAPEQSGPVLFEGGGGFAAAVLPILFSYNAWINSANVAEEVENPQRNLPIALGLGVGLVTVTYVAANAAYLYLLGPAGVATSSAVAAEAASRIVRGGGAIVAAAVVLSALGNLNGGVLANSRHPFAMARDGLLPGWLAGLRGSGNPGNAVLLTGVVMTAALWSGTVEQLIAWSIVVVWGMLFAAVAAVFVMRRRYPDAERPYKVPFYPWTPLAFLVAVGFVLAVSIVQKPAESLAGLIVVAAGWPVYEIMVRRRVSGREKEGGEEMEDVGGARTEAPPRVR